MAGEVFPKTAPRSRTSRAEVAVWEALRRQLPSGWRAWHSLRLRVGNRWEGEGDFVIAAPDRGLLVLEVKGGAIELRDGRWFQNGRELERAPRQQALDYVNHLVSVLRARGVEVPPYGVAIAFPDVEFSDELAPRAGDLAGLVIGARHLSWLDRALPALVDRAAPDREIPRKRGWISALHDLWGETWVPALNLLDEARDGDDRLVALVEDQLELLAAAEDNRRVVVTGGAGTGKTLLARELCARAATRGQRVLYLCFTDALGYAVERGFVPAQRTGARVRAMPIRRFAATLLEAAGVAIRPDDPSFWSTASLTAACDALPPPDDRPELVVVDEGQDLEPGDWDLVSELVGAGSLWILSDERQAFWRRPPLPESIVVGATRLKLRAQHRNPSAIAAHAARYLFTMHDGRASEPAIETDYAGSVRLVGAAAGTELDRLSAEVMELVRDGARPRDIAIITLAGQAGSQLLRRKTIGGQRLARADAPNASDGVVADTFLRFKGLERPFVFLVELSAGHANEYERRMYIATTRATSRLFVIATEQDLARDAHLAALAGR